MSNIIRRQRFTWTTVDNRIINDRRLSMKALGLLVFMLSKPDNWEFSQEQLGECFGEGREAMRSVMKVLAASGYVRREVVRLDNGQLRTLTIVTEEPETGFPTPAEPTPADPPAGLPAPLVKTDEVKTDEVKTEKSMYDPGFEEAWAAYPRKTGDSKGAAYKAWRARINEKIEPAEMTKGAAAYAAWCAAMKREPMYVLNGSTFFGPTRRFFDDWTVRGTKPSSIKSVAGMNYDKGVDDDGNIL